MTNEPKYKVYDKHGRPILPGDTLKILHYRAALKNNYMYKYVIGYNESKTMLIISHLDIAYKTYNMRLDGKVKNDIEIVQGFAGVPLGEDFSFRERKKS